LVTIVVVVAVERHDNEHMPSLFSVCSFSDVAITTFAVVVVAENEHIFSQVVVLVLVVVVAV